MPDIILETERLRQEVIDKLVAKGARLEDAVLKKVYQAIDEFDSKGGRFEISKTSRQKIIQLQNDIEAIFQESGYFKATEIFIQDLSKITANTIALHQEINKTRIVKSSLTNIENVYIESVKDKLVEGGLNQNFISPVVTAMNEATTFGYSIEQTRQTLYSIIKDVQPSSEGVGKLHRYLTTTARDTVSQMQGAQHQAIANNLEMPFGRYVGNLLKDSRGQCVRWRAMEYIPVIEFTKEIELAFKNQRNKVEENGHKYSGMIEGTTAENFYIRRGGWGCLHLMFPSRFKR